MIEDNDIHAAAYRMKKAASRLQTLAKAIGQLEKIDPEWLQAGIRISGPDLVGEAEIEVATFITQSAADILADLRIELREEVETLRLQWGGLGLAPADPDKQ